MRRSPIIDVTTRGVVLSAFVFAIYLLAAGHNQPGGGFIGGLVAGAGFALVYVAGGLDQVRRLLPVRPSLVVGAGLGVGAMSAIVPLLLGGAPLEQGYVKLHPPFLGDVKVTSALFFDIGVFAVVIGVVLLAIDALGEESRPGRESED